MNKPDIITRTKVASVASKILRNKNYSKAVKSAAGSALFQRKVLKKGVLFKAEKAASKTLRNSDYSKSAETAETVAGSILNFIEENTETGTNKED